MIKGNYLLIIDPSPIDAQLSDYFSKFNIDIMHQSTLNPIQTAQFLPCAILIDWALLKHQPKIISNIYSQYPVPILIINDTQETEPCITMLEAGADDFIVKPLYPRELHARINAISRRVIRTQPKLSPEKEVLAFANWRLYPASRQLFNKYNQELLLSVGEYDLLLIFIQRPQKILDREFLLQITKNSDLNPFDRRIDVQISRLRQKIEIEAKKPALIKTIRNGGYMFTEPVYFLKETSP